MEVARNSETVCRALYDSSYLHYADTRKDALKHDHAINAARNDDTGPYGAITRTSAVGP